MSLSRQKRRTLIQRILWQKVRLGLQLTISDHTSDSTSGAAENAVVEVDGTASMRGRFEEDNWDI